MENNPWMTLLLSIIIGCVLIELGKVVFSISNRFFRWLNIRKSGWPPEHCDGDGDFK
jgi:hypothetical protein